MESREIIFLNSVFFVLGFTVVFSLVGVALQTILQSVAYMAINYLRVVGGVVIVAFGILLIASAKIYVPFLASEHKLKVRKFSSSFFTSFVFGIAFAIGWTPCVGAILGAIYTLAAASPGIGFALLLAYSLGIGIPFMLVGAFTSRFSGFLKRIQGALKYFNIVSGLFLVALGILVVTNYIGILATFFLGPGGVVSPEGQLSFLLAFVAGIITFLSPCILPLLPAYFSFLVGTTASELNKEKVRRAKK